MSREDFTYDLDEEAAPFAAPPRRPDSRVRMSKLGPAAVLVALLPTILYLFAGQDLSGGWVALALTLGLPSVVAMVWFYLSLRGTEPGIKHDDTWFASGQNRGWSAWLWALGFTGFYVVLYFYGELQGVGMPPVLERPIRLLDPLAELTQGQPSSHWFLYGVLYTLAILVFGVRMLMRYRHSRYQQVRTVSVMFFQFGFAWFLPNLLVYFKQPYMEFNGVWPLKYDYLWPTHKIHEVLERAQRTMGMLPAVLVARRRPGRHDADADLLLRQALVLLLGLRLRRPRRDPRRPVASALRQVDPRLEDRALARSTSCSSVVVRRDGLALGQRATRRRRVVSGSWAYKDQAVPTVSTSASLFSGRRRASASTRCSEARVWCRFGCPQAAILGILWQRLWSRFRITANGDQCMSCGNCSTYCEMGIDVRAYAQRGENIVRASCVGCGVCSAVCPRGVLNLENGMTAKDRFDGADLPVLAQLRDSAREPDIYGYAAWQGPNAASAESGGEPPKDSAQRTTNA